jgi:hypothetical protein
LDLVQEGLVPSPLARTGWDWRPCIASNITEKSMDFDGMGVTAMKFYQAWKALIQFSQPSRTEEQWRTGPPRLRAKDGIHEYLTTMFTQRFLQFTA